MSDRKIILGTTLKAIADAIRNKLGTSKLYKPSEMAEAIESISTGTDVSDTTATAEDVASGRTFYGADSIKTEGSLVINSITPTSSTTPPSVSAGANYRPTTAGKLVGTYQELTPEDISLYLPMFSDVAYRFPNGGITIIKSTDVAKNPYKDVNYGEEVFDKGWNYMASAGWAYSSRQQDVNYSNYEYIRKSGAATVTCQFTHKPKAIVIILFSSNLVRVDFYIPNQNVFTRLSCANGTNVNNQVLELDPNAASNSYMWIKSWNDSTNTITVVGSANYYMMFWGLY